MWGQTDEPVQGEKIWETLKRYNPAAKTAVLFWQYTKYAATNIVLTPSPVHGERGMTEWCFSKPIGWHDKLVQKHGQFKLKDFWGPFASLESSKWIKDALLDTVQVFNPELVLGYLPHLDYQAQRFGPESEQAFEAVRQIDALVGEFINCLYNSKCEDDTAVLLLSEYAMHPVKRIVYLNRILRENGFVKVNTIGGSEYPDLYHSLAFAVVDHQVAHVYVQDCRDKEKIKRMLKKINGVGQVWDAIGKKRSRIDHARAGDLVVVAAKDTWFPYYWWENDAVAPSYARSVDIHRKPGYDPLELFLDPVTHAIPLKPEMVKGSHGSLPTTEGDLVSIIGIGAGSELLGCRSTWDARDINALILGMYGYYG